MCAYTVIHMTVGLTIVGRFLSLIVNNYLNHMHIVNFNGINLAFRERKSWFKGGV